MGRPKSPTIVMDDELWSRLRFQGLKEKRSASEIIRTLVKQYLDRVEKKGGKK